MPRYAKSQQNGPNVKFRNWQAFRPAPLLDLNKTKLNCLGKHSDQGTAVLVIKIQFDGPAQLCLPTSVTCLPAWLACLSHCTAQLYRHCVSRNAPMASCLESTLSPHSLRLVPHCPLCISLLWGCLACYSVQFHDSLLSCRFACEPASSKSQEFPRSWSRVALVCPRSASSWPSPPWRAWGAHSGHLPGSLARRCLGLLLQSLNGEALEMAKCMRTQSSARNPPPRIWHAACVHYALRRPSQEASTVLLGASKHWPLWWSSCRVRYYLLLLRPSTARSGNPSRNACEAAGRAIAWHYVTSSRAHRSVTKSCFSLDSSGAAHTQSSDSPLLLIGT